MRNYAYSIILLGSEGDGNLEIGLEAHGLEYGS
jgi:hypothetical protein